ncbi:M23 family peptidase [Helicobacter aurati]|uniref:M23 family peptidase n=1 Tax=Helicobacter aurati TaxID=137778 RepID=A0A3D8JA73_9HELI|nr:M23 family metallopeptidase [Helicobacter aurati]RDU73774.1 M23 family peptidase [Helicobacter aurati]
MYKALLALILLCSCALADSILTYSFPDSQVHAQGDSKHKEESAPYGITESESITKHHKNQLTIAQAHKDSQPTNVKHAATEQSIVIVENGKTAIVTTTNKNPQPLKIGKKTLQWIKHPKDSTKYIAIIPIHYYEKEGSFTLNNGQTLKIQRGNYRQERITITDSSKVAPNQSAKERIQRELAEANIIYKTYTTTRYWNTPFIYPMQSKITSPFGSARVFNNEVKSYHGGTDFRAKQGTPIQASNDGIVVIAKERFLAGKSVVISHGEGIFSQYYHCSEIKVKVGQQVKKGQVIALSGNTGRVSAPHLHFGFIINGIQIDPLHFIDTINTLFE